MYLHTAALIAGVVVTLLVVVVLLSLVGVVVAVVVVVRRNRKKEEQNVKAAEAYKLYKNKDDLQGKGSPDGSETIRSRNEVHKPVDPDHSSLKPGQDELTYAIAGPSSHPASFDADMYSTAHYSEVDQVQSGTQRARGVEPSSGGKWGHYEDIPFEVKNGANTDFGYAKPDTTTEEKKEEVNEPKDKMALVSQEHFYAQPDMAKKKNKRTQQQQGKEGVSEASTAASKPKEEIVPVCPEQFYAQPDMAKKRNKKAKQKQEQEGVSEDSKAAPPPPSPYKKALQEREEAVDAVP